jgi:hypothetical protein
MDTRGRQMIRLLWALATRCFQPDPFGAWWRKHVISDCPPHLDTCESCREVSCDCTKVKTCNQLHGLPVGRKAGRPTRRAQ